jgi:hypothetical protein
MLMPMTMFMLVLVVAISMVMAGLFRIAHGT